MTNARVPRNWSVTDLNSLRAEGDYTLIGGPFGSDLTQKDYVQTAGVPVIRGTNLGGTEGRFIDDGFVFVSEEKADRLRKNLAFPGDLVFTQRGTLGQVAIVPKDARFSRYVISQSQMKFTGDGSKVEHKFLYHYFRTPQTLERLRSQTQATGVPHINLGILKRFPVTLPCLPEQRRIAQILDQADALRAKRRAALALLDILTQSIFIDMFGDPSTNRKGWPVCRIGDCLDSASYGTSEKAGSTGEFPVLRMNNITSHGEMDLTNLKYMELPVATQGRYLVRGGDLLFNRTNSRDLVGKTAVFRESRPMAYAGYLIRLRPNDRTDPDYLGAFLNTGYAKKMLRGMCKSIIGMANINATEIQAMKIPSPPLMRQQEFQKRIAAIQALKKKGRDSLASLDTLFASLQHRAFRGEL